MLFKTLLLSMVLEFGFINGGIFNYHDRNILWENIGALYSSLNCNINVGLFNLGGEVISYFTPIKWNNYSPFQMTYILNASVDFKNAKLGYEHSCFHPMQPYATIIGNEIKPKYEGGYNKIFVRITH